MPVFSDGYFLKAPENPEAAPCRWIVEADSDGSGKLWVPVSASVWRTAFSGGGSHALQLYPGLRAAAPSGQGAFVTVDHGSAVLPAVLFAMVYLELGACMLCIVAAALLDREDTVRGIILTFVAGAGILTVAEAIAWESTGNCRAAADALLRMSALFSLELALGLFEDKLVLALFGASAVYTIAIAGADALYGIGWGEAFELAMGPEFCAVAFLLAVTAFCVRWAVMTRAQRMVLADAARYDDLWAAISSGEDSEKGLAAIREQVPHRA